MEERRRSDARIDEIQRQLSYYGTTLAVIQANTACLPKMLERIDDLESSRDRGRGIMWLLGFIWAAIEAFFHLGHKG